MTIFRALTEDECFFFGTDAKQLKWEVDRDRWLRGKNDWRSKRGGKPGRKQGHFKHKGRQFGGKAKQKGKKNRLKIIEK